MLAQHRPPPNNHSQKKNPRKRHVDGEDVNVSLKLQRSMIHPTTRKKKVKKKRIINPKKLIKTMTRKRIKKKKRINRKTPKRKKKPSHNPPKLLIK